MAKVQLKTTRFTLNIELRTSDGNQGGVQGPRAIFASAIK